MQQLRSHVHQGLGKLAILGISTGFRQSQQDCGARISARIKRMAESRNVLSMTHTAWNNSRKASSFARNLLTSAPSGRNMIER